MSYYDEGYEKGHADALEGKPSFSDGIIFGALSAILNDDEQYEYEDGYRDGHAAGKEETQNDE